MLHYSLYLCERMPFCPKDFESYLQMIFKGLSWPTGLTNFRWDTSQPIEYITAPVMTIFPYLQKRGQPLEVYPNFRKQFSQKFSFHSTLPPEFLKFSAEWFAFGILYFEDWTGLDLLNADL